MSSIFFNIFCKWLWEVCIVLSQKMVFWVIKSQFLRYAQVSMQWIIEKWQDVGSVHVWFSIRQLKHEKEGLHIGITYINGLIIQIAL